MKIEIFNVAHGFCAYLVADNGNVMLFDCGHNNDTGFKPSNYLRSVGCTGIEKLVITNYDQDHISDLPNLRQSLPIQLIYRNKSVSTSVLRTLKLESGPISQAMESAIDMFEKYCHAATQIPEFPNVELIQFHNCYPEFTDTNNLSLVSFINYGELGIVFPGDLEASGWKRLLSDSDFISNLKRVNIFVASHHGRKDGYCAEVFDYCKPDIVIISDKEIVHETQKNVYAKHAFGVPWNGGSEIRYVLTTRDDGNISITMGNNTYKIT